MRTQKPPAKKKASAPVRKSTRTRTQSQPRETVVNKQKPTANFSLASDEENPISFRTKGNQLFINGYLLRPVPGKRELKRRDIELAVRKVAGQKG